MLAKRIVSALFTLTFLCCGPIMLAATPEPITLEVVFAGGLFAAGRDPNVNVVQDYGPTSWTEIVAEEFRKVYPHINLTFRSSTIEQTAVLIASGTGPDIVHGWGHPFINLGRQGAFINLSPLLTKDGIDYVADQIFWAPQYAAFSHQGEQFALPEYLGTIAIGYNADLFSNVGISPPEPWADGNTMDWDDFANLAKKLTSDTTGDGTDRIWGFNKIMGNDRIEYWLKAAGANYYGDDARTVSALDSPEAVNALEYLQRLRWDDQVIPPAGTPANWEQGQVAMTERGTWDLVRVLGKQSDGTPKVSFQWNVFPLPVGPSGKRTTLATIDGYAINRNTPYPEEAYALLQFLAGPQANEIRAKYLMLQPAHRDVLPEFLRLVHAMTTESHHVSFEVFADAGPYAEPQLLYADQGMAQTVLNEAYARIFDDNQAAGPVWFDTIQRLNRLLSSN